MAKKRPLPKDLSVHDKLELFRRVYCLGEQDIENIYGYNDHLVCKYRSCRDDDGFYGNFTFLFELDENNAKYFFEYIGF